MRKFFTLSLAMLFASTLTVMAQSAASKQMEARFAQPKGRNVVAVPGMHGRTAAQFQLDAAGLPQARKAPAQSDAQPAVTTTSPSFGYLTGPDGNQWYYTQSFTTEKVDYSTYYTSSVITVFDSNNEQQGTVTLNFDASMCINSIEPFGNITSRLFDHDASTYEIMVTAHYVTSDYVGGYKTYAYNLNGEKVAEFDGSGLYFDGSQGWTTYQRLLMPHNETDEDGTVYTHVDVYAPPSIGSTEMKLEHTFRVNEDLYNYSPGAFLNCFVANGKPYYVVSYYEKPYITGYDYDTWEMIVNEDNHFVIETYDRNFEKVDSFAVPIEKPNDAYYRFAAFGLMSDKDLSDGYFTEKGERAYVITYLDYITSLDSELADFVVFDHEGNQIKTVCEDAAEYVWFELSPIKGASDQMAFLQQSTTEQQIQMVDLPSCELSTLLPTYVESLPITTTLDRYAVGDSYQYVVKISTADTDADGNTIARIAWINPDLSLDHLTTFNLGSSGEYFTPLLNSQTLTPYLFDTDDDLEFIYLAKKKRADSDVVDNVLEIADEHGNIEHSWVGDDTWKIYSPAVLDMSDTKQQLLIGYLNEDDEQYKLDFFNLPFTKFTQGGDGSAESPYLISTLGDLKQISGDLEASYKLVADIDMNHDNNSWTPINSFSGVLDGNSHVIANLNINTSNYRAGFFGDVAAGAKIRNLVFAKPTIELNSSNGYAGVLAGELLADTLTNVHVFDAHISDVASQATLPTVGGLVGQASSYSLFESCSFGGEINVPTGVSVGGILGASNTATELRSCSATGNYIANQALGGIVGSTNKGGNVYNARVDATLSGVKSIGGIVGDNSERSKIVNSIALGNIISTGKPKWGGRALGGIVGYLGSDWSSSRALVVKNNVSGMTISYDEPTDGEEADATIHRIAGQTIENETYEPDETPQEEQGLSNNYVLSTVLVGGEEISSTDANSLQGATTDVTDLTTKRLTALGFDYGTETAAPWKETAELPILYYEQEPLALMLSQSALEMEVDETASIIASVYGVEAEEITVSSSDPAIVEAAIGKTEGTDSSLQLTCRGAGTAIITVQVGDLAADCIVTCYPTGISQVTNAGSSIAISLNGSVIKATGAVELNLYTATGQLIGAAQGSQLNASHLGTGVYVIVAKGTDGHLTSAKLVMK